MEDSEVVQAIRTLVQESLKAVDQKISNSSSAIIVQGRVIGILGAEKFLVRINKEDHIAKSHYNHKLGSTVSLLTTNKKTDYFIIY